jgi:hypothetical protein
MLRVRRYYGGELIDTTQHKKTTFLACSLIGLHMGLAHGNAGGVHDCPQCGNYRTQYRLFFVEVSVIRWKHCSSSAHLAYEYN